MGAELRAPKPTAKRRCLFEDEDRDVRGWAGSQFTDVDPEWASATIDGLPYKLTVHEVLALRARSIANPPPGLPLKDMSIGQLIDRFKDACTRLYATTRSLSDDEGGGMTMIAYNHVVGEGDAIAKELAARGKLDVLVHLFDHPLITVRKAAATHCLPVATDRAVATLEAIEATKVSPECEFAGMTLCNFRNDTHRGVSAQSS